VSADTIAMHSPMEVPSDHPSYAGHFPQFPVLPGAVLLDEALKIMQSTWGIDLAHWQIGSAKFLGSVHPGDALHLEHHAPQRGLIHFTIRVADRTVASGSLRSTAGGAGA
jgi:3-hydroxymyristoyl/3-hydroxydecanoyl-(acyl carrier protein) dehydratase